MRVRATPAVQSLAGPARGETLRAPLAPRPRERPERRAAARLSTSLADTERDGGVMGFDASSPQRCPRLPILSRGGLATDYGSPNTRWT